MAYTSQKDHNRTITRAEAYEYATGIVAITGFLVVAFNAYMFFALNIVCKLRVACSGLIYKKALRIAHSMAKDGQNGRIINMLSSDLARFEMAFTFLHEIWEGPLQLVLFSVVIYMQIGVFGVFGVVFMLAFIPLQGIIIIHFGFVQKAV